MPLATQILVTSAVATTGLLSGAMVAIALQQQTAQKLMADCWVDRQNLSDRLFRKVMPPMFVITLLSSGSALAFLHDTSRLWMAGGLVASVLVVALTVALEVPINDRTSTWKSGNIPDDWQHFRDAWLRNHWWRTWCGVAGFLCSLVAMVTAHV